MLFYSDSNIYPAEEFDKRWQEVVKVARHYGLEAIREEQDHAAWLEAVRGHEDDREGGGRCALCFHYNLARAAAEAERLGIPRFCTTLTVSRFKSSRTIFDQGAAFPSFEEWDFKKKDGFNRSIQLAKGLGLYRQDYCGCEFSLRSRAK